MKHLCLLLLLVVVGCGRREVAVSSGRPAPARPVAAAGLRNVFRVSDKCFSGSTPDGPSGFASLQALGVKTVITVDGATPDVAEAERHGMRYVHLPVGYNGIPRAQALRLAKAVRDLPGPVYVHCHHGQHRGPAACSAIQLLLDPTYTPEQAEAFLKAAGTDPKYTGLMRLPWTLERTTPEELDRVPSDFPTTTAVPDLTARMVKVDEWWETLKRAKAAGWKPPQEGAGVHAVMLVEQYREAARLPAAKGMPFAEAEARAKELERAIRSGNVATANSAFTRSAKSCATCHAAHRDQPKP